MRKLHRIALLLFAVSLLTVLARPRALVARDTDEVSSTPSSQAVHADTILPASSNQPGTSPFQPTQYQMDQDTHGPEPQGALEYMDANEQVSVYGIEMRIDTRKAEREVQGLLVIDIEPGSPGATAGLRPFRERTRDVLNGVGMLAAMAFPPALVNADCRVGTAARELRHDNRCGRHARHEFRRLVGANAHGAAG